MLKIWASSLQDRPRLFQVVCKKDVKTTGNIMKIDYVIVQRLIKPGLNYNRYWTASIKHIDANSFLV